MLKMDAWMRRWTHEDIAQAGGCRDMSTAKGWQIPQQCRTQLPVDHHDTLARGFHPGEGILEDRDCLVREERPVDDVIVSEQSGHATPRAHEARAEGTGNEIDNLALLDGRHDESRHTVFVRFVELPTGNHPGNAKALGFTTRGEPDRPKAVGERTCARQKRSFFKLTQQRWRRTGGGHLPVYTAGLPRP